jgi:hypothetical protein
MSTMTARSIISPSIGSSRTYVPRNMPTSSTRHTTAYDTTYGASYSRPGGRSTSRDPIGSYATTGRRTSSASKRSYSPVRGLSTDRYSTDKYKTSSSNYSSSYGTYGSGIKVKPVSNPRPLPSTPTRSATGSRVRPLKNNYDSSTTSTYSRSLSHGYESEPEVKTYSKKLNRTNSVNQMVSKFENVGIGSSSTSGSTGTSSLRNTKRFGSQNDLYNGTSRSTVSTPEKLYQKASVLGGTTSSTPRDRGTNSFALDNARSSDKEALPQLSSKTTTVVTRSPSIDRVRQSSVENEATSSSSTLSRKPPVAPTSRQNSHGSLSNVSLTYSK